jgi:hypothetical protein
MDLRGTLALSDGVRGSDRNETDMNTRKYWRGFKRIEKKRVSLFSVHRNRNRTEYKYRFVNFTVTTKFNSDKLITA